MSEQEHDDDGMDDYAKGIVRTDMLESMLEAKRAFTSLWNHLADDPDHTQVILERCIQHHEVFIHNEDTTMGEEGASIAMLMTVWAKAAVKQRTEQGGTFSFAQALGILGLIANKLQDGVTIHEGDSRAQ